MLKHYHDTQIDEGQLNTCKVQADEIAKLELEYALYENARRKMLGRFLRKRGTFLHFSDILYPAKEHRPLDLARKDAMILHETYLKNPEFANIQKISGKLLGGKISSKTKAHFYTFCRDYCVSGEALFPISKQKLTAPYFL